MRGRLLSLVTPYHCCWFWAGEWQMLFLLLSSSPVLWKRRQSSQSSEHRRTRISPLLRKRLYKERKQWKCVFDPGPTSQVSGFLTHGTFPRELTRSPESMKAADRESQWSLQGKITAWDPASLLSETKHCSETCQLQFVIFPGEDTFHYRFLTSCALCCHHSSRWECQKGQKDFWGGCIEPWEIWHYSRSAVLAATAQPWIQVWNVRYSLQN